VKITPHSKISSGGDWISNPKNYLLKRKEKERDHSLLIKNNGIQNLEAKRIIMHVQ
jgi:hypothetical protein